jgi:hypothetical protein
MHSDRRTSRTGPIHLEGQLSLCPTKLSLSVQMDFQQWEEELGTEGWHDMHTVARDCRPVHMEGQLPVQLPD